MEDLRRMEDYHTLFNPKTYLEMFYKSFKGNENEQGLMQFFPRSCHEFWSNFEAGSSSVANSEVRHLEYGGGPSIASLVSACPKLDHIVFAEYTEANRQAVKSWIAGSPDAHDWTPLVEFILCDLEGLESPARLMDESISQAINERTNRLKKKIKSIVPCDVTKVPIVQLEPGDIGKPFDVVSTTLCLEVCVSSELHYKNVVAELCKLLKPDGYIFMSGVLGETFYCVGKEKFYAFPLDEKMVKEAMNEAGIQIQKFETIPMTEIVSDCKGLFYTYGRKYVL